MTWPQMSTAPREKPAWRQKELSSVPPVSHVCPWHLGCSLVIPDPPGKPSESSRCIPLPLPFLSGPFTPTVSVLLAPGGPRAAGDAWTRAACYTTPGFINPVALYGLLSSWGWFLYGQELKSHMPPGARPEEKGLERAGGGSGSAPGRLRETGQLPGGSSLFRRLQTIASNCYIF